MKTLGVSALLLTGMALLSCGGGESSSSRPDPTDGATTGVSEVPSLTLAPALDAEGVLPETVQEARTVIERRLTDLGIVGIRVEVDGDRIHFFGPEIEPSVANAIARAGRLMFCQPIIDDAGRIAVVVGDVRYKPLSCDPQRDAQGNIIASFGGGGGDARIEFAPWESDTFISPQVDIVWQPASAIVNGQEVVLTGELVERNEIIGDPQSGTYALTFQLASDGADVMSAVTARLAAGQYPMTFFLDGAPVRAADGSYVIRRVGGEIGAEGVIGGLTELDAQSLSRALKSGALPFNMRIVVE